MKRIDVIWDEHLDCRVENSALEKGENGASRKVNLKSKIPSRWLGFLQVADNNKHLFAFLNDVVAKFTLPEWKEIHFVSQQ